MERRALTYEESFGLTKSPFDTAPDAGFLFLPVRHREALAGVCYALLAKKGLTVLIGDAGTGKTTLLASIVQHLGGDHIHFSLPRHPMLTAGEFLEAVISGFGIAEVPSGKSQRMAALRDLLLKWNAQNRICALAVDEAEKLSPALLEEVRLLENLESGDSKLLQILLLGQNRLGELLNRADMRQLKQRVATRFTIGALGAGEVAEYIQYRWTRAGGAQTAPFTADSLAAIAQYSKGIPRTVSAICHTALTIAASDSMDTV